MLNKPGYLALYENGELQKRIEFFNAQLNNCVICARECHVNRSEKMGWCKTGNKAIVSSYNAHFGEEAPLVGLMGSGTIFFTNCNLGCIFCQNYTISQDGKGKEVDKNKLANILIHLQHQGCHNINLVSPSHVIAQIVEALPIAIEAGLNIPLVYNTGCYDNPEMIKMLNGIIDIYMPDIKFGDNETGLKLANAKNYWDNCKQCIKIMHDQVGDLEMINGIATKGLIIRHLILPDNLSCSQNVFEFIADEISTNTYLNIMDQYNPAYKANTICALNRKITMREYHEAIALAESYGLTRLD